MVKALFALLVVLGFSTVHATTDTTTTTVAATTGAVVPASVPGSAGNVTSISSAEIEKKKNFAFGYIAESYVPMASANTQEFDKAIANQHVSAKYSFNDSRSLQFRQYFLYNMTDDKRTDEWAIGDSVFQYTDSNMLKLGTLPVLGYARLYMPVSESSRDLGKYELRLLGGVTYALENRFKFTTLINPRFYTYTENSDSQRSFRLIPGIELAHQTTSKIEFYVAAYTDHSWMRSGKKLVPPVVQKAETPEDISEEGSDDISVMPTSAPKATYESTPVNSDIFLTYVGMRAKPAKNVSLNFYIETMDNLRDSQVYYLFDEARSSYGLDLSLTF